jgi:hypothetical protein
LHGLDRQSSGMPGGETGRSGSETFIGKRSRW